MAKIAAYLVIGIGVGLGLAWWQGIGRPGDDAVTRLPVADRAPLEDRISQLETALARERYEREQLADEVASLKGPAAESPTAADGPRDPRQRSARFGQNDAGSAAAEALRERFPDGFPQTPEELDRFQKQRQIDALVRAGFSNERAEYILQREDELQLEVQRARYEAGQNGAAPAEVARLGTAELLRKELGDADYEKYLAAQGRPTSVAVRDVLTNSPAQTAGLKPGDEIVAYNGQRVFDINELSDLTNQARIGSTASMEIVRDGQHMQVFVEAGPIGISGGGRAGGNRRDFQPGAVGGFGGRADGPRPQNGGQ